MTSEQKAVANLLDAVEGVLQYTWDDNDEDAAEAIDRLRKANDDLGVVQRIAAKPATLSSKTVIPSGFLAALDRQSGDGFDDETCQTAARIIRDQQGEIEQLRGELDAAEQHVKILQDQRVSGESDPGTTHAIGCGSWGPKHYERILSELRGLERAYKKLESQYGNSQRQIFNLKQGSQGETNAQLSEYARRVEDHFIALSDLFGDGLRARDTLDAERATFGIESGKWYPPVGYKLSRFFPPHAPAEKTNGRCLVEPVGGSVGDYPRCEKYPDCPCGGPQPRCMFSAENRRCTLDAGHEPVAHELENAAVSRCPHGYEYADLQTGAVTCESACCSPPNGKGGQE